jgi:putative ABC transport system ATP-binding protein
MQELPTDAHDHSTSRDCSTLPEPHRGGIVAVGPSPSIISLTNIRKRLGSTDVLRDLCLEIPAGELLAIGGISGSGKSTLLNIMAGLLPIDSGVYKFDGMDVSSAKRNNALARQIRRQTGYISQASDMISNFSSGENIELAGLCRGMTISKDDVRRVLLALGLDGFESRNPTKVSGGQRQRVNIARGLACNPKVLFADEPTGALDVFTGRSVVNLLVNASRARQITLVLVTHNPEFAALCDRQVVLHRGRIHTELRTSDPGEIDDAITACAKDSNS